MIAAILAILAGLLLISELFSGSGKQAIEKMRPWQTVMGVIALVVGILNIISVIGIALILGGLILAANAMTAIPSVGDDLRKAGRYLAQFGVVIGVLLLIIGIVALF